MTDQFDFWAAPEEKKNDTAKNEPVEEPAPAPSKPDGDEFFPDGTSPAEFTETPSAGATSSEASPAPGAPAFSNQPVRYVDAQQAPQYQQPTPVRPPYASNPCTAPTSPGFAPQGTVPPQSAVPQQRPYAAPPSAYPVQPPAGPYAQQPGYPLQPGNPSPTNYQPFYSPYYPPAAPQKPVNGMSVASLILGILSLVLFCFPFLNVVLGILALVLGIAAQVKGGGGMAIAGIVLGSVSTVFGILMIILMLSDTINYTINDPYYDWDNFAAAARAWFRR